MRGKTTLSLLHTHIHKYVYTNLLTHFLQNSVGSLIGVRILGYIKNKKMELLYFISGILSVGITYGIILLRNVKSSHTELLEKHQSQSNISSIRFDEYRDDLDDLNILLGDIQDKMEKDQYESVSIINKEMKGLGTTLNDTINRMEFAMKSNEKNFSTVFNDVQQIKSNLKALGQDPSMLNRY